MSQRRDNIHCKAHQQRPNGGVYRPKERENDSQKPDRNHHWQPRNSPQANAFGIVHSNDFLPHEVQGRTSETERNKLHPQEPMSEFRRICTNFSQRTFHKHLPCIWFLPGG